MTSAPKEGNSKENSVDLDAADELASRSLLLGILHRTAGEYKVSRTFLEHALTFQNAIPTSLIIPTSMFELATLDLVEVEKEEKATKPQADNATITSEEKGSSQSSDSAHKKRWKQALDAASSKLDKVGNLATNTTLSTRIESRVQMLRDEIGYKTAQLGL